MNLNLAQIIGNLGDSPSLRYTKNGTAVCDLRVATNERFTTSAGEKKTDTQWHRIVVFGKRAESCAQYLTKGRLVRVEGKIVTKKWTDKENIVRYTTEIVAKEVDFGPSTSQNQQQQEAPAPEAPADHRDIQF